MRKLYFTFVAASLTAMAASAHGVGSSAIVADNDQIITETPQGTLIDNAYYFSRDWASSWDGIHNYPLDGMATKLVVTDQNFYIYNPLASYRTNSWLKGNLKKAATAGDPDIIEVQLPQAMDTVTLQDQDGNDSTGVVYIKKMQLSKSGMSLVPAADQVLRFTWNGDTLRSLDKGLLAMVDGNDRWQESAADSLIVFKQKEVATVVPSDAQKCNFVLTYLNNIHKEQNELVEGYRKDDDYYLTSTLEGQDFVAKGSLKDGKVVFPYQYLGVHKDGVHVFFIPAHVSYTYNNTYQKYLYSRASFLKGGLSFNVDATTSDLSTDQNSDNGFFINTGKFYFSNNVYYRPKLTPWQDEAYQPQAPEITYVSPYTEYGSSSVKGFGYLMFNLPVKDANGTLLDVNKLYYQVYFDPNKSETATPFVFKKDVYDLTADTDKMPASYDDKNNIQVFDGVRHQVLIIDPIMSNTEVGVRAVYEGGNTTTTTPIVWMHVDKGDSGINGVTVNHGEVAGVSYYDLSGRRVAEPAAGIYVKAVKYADGTIETQKVVK